MISSYLAWSPSRRWSRGWRTQLHPGHWTLDGARGRFSIGRRTGSKPQVAAMVSAERSPADQCRVPLPHGRRRVHGGADRARLDPQAGRHQRPARARPVRSLDSPSPGQPGHAGVEYEGGAGRTPRPERRRAASPGHGAGDRAAAISPPAAPPQRRHSAPGRTWLRAAAATGAAPDDRSVPTERELRRRSRQLELEAALGWESLPESPQPKTKAGLDYHALRQQFADEMRALLTLSDEQAAANEG
jgi:hypothetical protein